MQEEINQKVMAVSFKAARLTSDVLKKVFEEILQDAKNAGGILKSAMSKEDTTVGRNELKVLNKDNKLETIDVTENMKDFDKCARKYGIEYAATKNKATDPPTYTIYFKSKDTEVMTQCFKDYVGKNEKKATRNQNRVSVKEKMEQMKVKFEILSQKEDKVRVKDRGMDR